MPETGPGAGAEMARTAAKREEGVMQERSLRGTVSVERGMATKRVVRDCLWGARGGDVDVDVGVGKREEVDGVGCGVEWAEGVSIVAESRGEVGFGVGVWRLRFVGRAGGLGSVESCPWYCSGALGFFPPGCLLIVVSSMPSAGASCCSGSPTALSSVDLELRPWSSRILPHPFERLEDGDNWIPSRGPIEGCSTRSSGPWSSRILSHAFERPEDGDSWIPSRGTTEGCSTCSSGCDPSIFGPEEGTLSIGSLTSD